MTDRLLVSHICVQVSAGACIMCAYISCVYITSDSILIKQHMLSSFSPLTRINVVHASYTYFLSYIKVSKNLH